MDYDFPETLGNNGDYSGLMDFNLLFHILGMSSSQLTHIFQRGRYTTNQKHLLLGGFTMCHFYFCCLPSLRRWN